MSHVSHDSRTLTHSQALGRSPIPALRKLSLEETDGVVVINGRVSSYYLKQLAQEAVMPALGGRELRNRVAVVPEPVLQQSERRDDAAAAEAPWMRRRRRRGQTRVPAHAVPLSLSLPPDSPRMKIRCTSGGRMRAAGGPDSGADQSAALAFISARITFIGSTTWSTSSLNRSPMSRSVSRPLKCGYFFTNRPKLKPS